MEAVVVTRNGYSEFVVMRSDDYDLLREEVAKARLMRVLADADRAYERGDYIDGPSFVADPREKDGL